MRKFSLIALVVTLSMVKSMNAVLVNPLEVYIGVEEGFAIYRSKGGVEKVFINMIYSSVNADPFIFVHCGALVGQPLDNPDYSQCYKRDYNRMEVLSQNGNQFRIKYQILATHDWHELIPYEVTKDFESTVWQDGSISLKCVGNGLYLHGIDNMGLLVNSKADDPCTEDGICPTCKFHVEIGTLDNVQIEIVGLEFGQPEDGIPPTPDIVLYDDVINRSDDPMPSTFVIKFEEATSETTTWEHAWGIELSASLSATVNFILESYTISMGVTLSYNGKYGTSSTVDDKQTVEKRQSYDCPSRHHCFFNLMANHLDNQKVPFTATVRKIVGSTVTEYEEKGTWMGVKSFNFFSEYCTTNIDTGESNCQDRKQVRIE